VLANTANIDKWHANKLADATTVESVKAMITADAKNADWVKDDKIKLTAVEATAAH